MSTTPDVSVSGNETLVSTVSTPQLSHSKEDLHMLKGLLEKKIAEKEIEIGEAREAIRSNLKATKDIVFSSEAEIVNVSQIQLDKATQYRGDLERAVERMRNRVYGVCYSCDPAHPHLIPIEELKLVPTRTKCIEGKKREDERPPAHKKN